ncbi:MAG: hypothetical protein H7A21_19610 [Spirochaetales bacterium]|nr:hypothetical protein [Leptospiraceae bacterium]MCP5483654.1 hypothetical protein [Spirochaetales bacterium]MCP5484481.1 hypothetical protein [Spirochaetales bacterium]
MKRIFCVCIIGLMAFPSLPALAQQPDLSAARELLAMPDQAAREAISKLTPEEAIALLSQVRAVARPRNPEVDRITLLITHLERIRAVEREQRRLNNLLIVIGVILGLFWIFLAYVFFDQRRTLRALQASRPESGSGPIREVYRGE